MATQKKGMPVGCWIAIAVTGFVVLMCGGGALAMGWAVWTDPDVQRAVEIGGAAFDLANDAQNAPGAAELRRHGCMQAMVITPEILERFADSFGVDGGVRDLPDIPIVSCTVRRGSPVTCQSAAEAYMTALSSPPPEVAITVQVQNQNQTQCQGVYNANAELVREFDETEQQFRQAPPP